MNEYERLRASVPISGIDTSTPDAVVADGKCEKLHNMRYAAGTWRNVNDIPIEEESPTKWPIKYVYKHPAAGDNSYVALVTEDYHPLWENRDGVVVYIEPQDTSGPVEAYRKVDGKFEGIETTLFYDADKRKYIDLYSEEQLLPAYKWKDDGDVDYLTTRSVPKVGDVLYRLSEDLLIEVIGVIGSVDTVDQFEEYTIGVIDVDGDTITFDLTYVEKIDEVSLPVSTKAPLIIPPHAIVSINESEDIQVLCQCDPAQLKINHFGNTLFVNHPQLLTFVLRDGKYYYTDFSRIHFICEDTQFIRDDEEGITDSFIEEGVVMPPRLTGEGPTGYYMFPVKYYPLANRNKDLILRTHEGRFWRGEICYFLAARMEDGTVVATSPLFISGTNPTAAMPIVIHKVNGEKCYCLYGGIDLLAPNIPSGAGEEFLKTYNLYGHYSQVKFTMVTDMEFPLVADIALFSTRIMPTYEISALKSYRDAVWDSNSIYGQQQTSDTAFTSTQYHLKNEPFYFVDAISIKAYESGSRTFVLDYDALKDISSNAIYEPNNNIAPIVDYQAYKDYNNSAHFGGVSRRIHKGFVYRDEMLKNKGGIRLDPSYNILYDPNGFIPDYPDDDRDYDSDFYPDDDGGYDDGGYDDGGYDDGGYDDGGYDDMEVYAMQRAVPADTTTLKDIIIRLRRGAGNLYALAKDINKDSNDWYIPNIVSYPDASAESLMFATDTIKGSTGVECILSPLAAINYAIYIPKSSTKKFAEKWTPAEVRIFDRTNILKDIEEDTVFTELNKMMVSQTNNNFKFPFDQTYSIGTESNQILAINSGAIEMSDAKFGEMPLYVFTEEGIYAMQSGQNNVLYSATIPINYDRIINPQTLAVNYNIVYITREGVKSLSAQTTSLLSEAINGPNNIPLLDYLQSANLYHHKPYNEIIVHNPNYDYAYIYAVNGGYWSTRDLWGVKLDSERLYIGDSVAHRILNLAKHEGNEVRPISIRTRALKFGNHEFKRLETFIARMRAVPGAAVVIRFYGSNDRVNWALMREVEFENIDIEMTLRRFPFSARYIYVEFESDGIEATSAYFEISSMDMEYYLKFVRRLR